MQGLKWFFITLVSACVLTAVFALGRCAGAWTAHQEPKTEHYDRQEPLVTTADTIYVPLPVKTVRDVVPADVDTNAIIEEYFSHHIYRDTLRASAPGKLGGSAVAVISDTIAHNVIAGRTVSLTFTPNRLATTRSVDLLSTWGLGNTSVMAGYRYGRWTVYAGYNFSSRAPTAGVGYQLLNW